MNIQEEIVCRLQILIQKADQVIATNKPNPPGVIGFPTLSSELFSEWASTKWGENRVFFLYSSLNYFVNNKDLTPEDYMYN